METTAPVQFKTESEQMAELQEKALNLINQEHAAEITTADENDKAADLGKLLRSYRKKLEDDRKALVGPLNDVVKALNGKYKPTVDAIDKAISSLKGKMTGFARIEAERIRKEQEEARKREEEAALAAAEAADGDEAESILNDAAEKGEAIASQAAQVKGHGNFGGSSHTASKLLWEVTKPEEVPIQFLSVDQYKVQAAIDQAKAQYKADGINKNLKGPALTNYINEAVAANVKIPGIKITADLEVRIR